MSIDDYRLRRRDPNDTHCHCGHKWSDGSSRHNEATHDRIAELEANLERTRQAWVDGDDPMCEDVCLVECKGPCGVGGEDTPEGTDE